MPYTTEAQELINKHEAKIKSWKLIIKEMLPYTYHKPWCKYSATRSIDGSECNCGLYDQLDKIRELINEST